MKKEVRTFVALTCAASRMLSADFNVSGEFLYWYGQETGLTYGVEAVGVNTVPADVVGVSGGGGPLIAAPLPGNVGLPQRASSAPSSYLHFQPDWKPGFRVGIGYSKPYAGWDVTVIGTYFYTNDKQSTSVSNFGAAPEDGQHALINPWVNPAVGLSSGTGTGPLVKEVSVKQPLFTDINADWRFNLYQIDLVLGNCFEVGNCFAVRPYAGLRGAITRTNFHTQSIIDNVAELNSVIDYNAVFSDRYKERFTGVGLVAGLQPSWNITECLSLQANASWAILWGRYECDNHQDYVGRGTLSDGSVTVEDIVVFNYGSSNHNRVDSFQPVLDLGLYIGWERDWGCLVSYVQLGWEHHVWFRHTQRNKLVGAGTILDVESNASQESVTFTDDFFTGFVYEPHDIAFGGPVLRVGIQF